MKFTPYDELQLDMDVARDISIPAGLILPRIQGGLGIALREIWWPDEGPWMVFTTKQVTDSVRNLWSQKSVKKTMKKLEAMGILRTYQHGKATAYRIDFAAIDRYVTHREPSKPE